MASKKRDHKSTYERRNERARALGFKSYAEQRKARKQVDELTGLTKDAKQFAKKNWKRDQLDALVQTHDRAKKEFTPDTMDPWQRMSADLQYAADRDSAMWSAFRKEYGRKK